MLARSFWMIAACALMVATTAQAQYYRANLPPDEDSFYRLMLEDAEDEVAQALIQAGAGDKVEVVMIGQRDIPIYKHDAPISVAVKDIDFNATAHSWEANVLIVSQGEVLTAKPMNGRYEELVDVPVLAVRMHEGDIIAKQDIEWTEFRADRIRKGTVFNPERLVGKSPRRSISAGRPIREGELQEPIITRKGDVVKIFFTTPHMEISTLGEAMEDGAAGDRIRVRNTESDSIITAIVESANQVRVTTPATAREIRRNP